MSLTFFVQLQKSMEVTFKHADSSFDYIVHGLAGTSELWVHGIEI